MACDFSTASRMRWMVFSSNTPRRDGPHPGVWSLALASTAASAAVWRLSHGGLAEPGSCMPARFMMIHDLSGKNRLDVGPRAPWRSA